MGAGEMFNKGGVGEMTELHFQQTLSPKRGVVRSL